MEALDRPSGAVSGHPFTIHIAAVYGKTMYRESGGRPAADDLGVAQELDTDDLGSEAGKGEALRGAQEQLEVQPVRVEQRATEDRGVKRHDLYCDARLRLRICSTVSAPDTSPWASWRRASVC